MKWSWNFCFEKIFDILLCSSASQHRERSSMSWTETFSPHCTFCSVERWRGFAVKEAARENPLGGRQKRRRNHRLRTLSAGRWSPDNIELENSSLPINEHYVILNNSGHFDRFYEPFMRSDHNFGTASFWNFIIALLFPHRRSMGCHWNSNTRMYSTHSTNVLHQNSLNSGMA